MTVDVSFMALLWDVAGVCVFVIVNLSIFILILIQACIDFEGAKVQAISVWHRNKWLKLSTCIFVLLYLCNVGQPNVWLKNDYLFSAGVYVFRFNHQMCLLIQEKDNYNYSYYRLQFLFLQIRQIRSKKMKV